MSMISEQIKKFRYFSLDNEIDMLGVRELQMLLEEAADTIEELSAKLASANMERSTAYYNDGWIPCKKDLPKISNSYLVTKMYENDGNPIYETAHEIFWIKDMKWDCERDEFCVWKVIAWQNKLTPYRPEGDKNE